MKIVRPSLSPPSIGALNSHSVIDAQIDLLKRSAAFGGVPFDPLPVLALTIKSIRSYAGRQQAISQVLSVLPMHVRYRYLDQVVKVEHRHEHAEPTWSK